MMVNESELKDLNHPTEESGIFGIARILSQRSQNLPAASDFVSSLLTL